MKPPVLLLFLLVLATAALLRAESPGSSRGMLLVANQFDHTVGIVDLDSGKQVGKAGVDINGHEVAVAPDHRLGYVPIYGNSGVGKPGTDGSTVEVVDLGTARALQV